VSDLHVRVHVADEDYALPVGDVLEVGELGELTPVPGAGAWVLGVRNLRGQVLPVVDLAAVFGLTSSEPDRIVIAERAGRKLGLAVDSIAGVERLSETSQEVEARHLTRAALAGDSLVGVVDVASVLDAVEAQRAS
jgi:chemotaxis signal transduction protein